MPALRVLRLKVGPWTYFQWDFGSRLGAAAAAGTGWPLLHAFEISDAAGDATQAQPLTSMHLRTLLAGMPALQTLDVVRVGRKSEVTVMAMQSIAGELGIELSHGRTSSTSMWGCRL